MESFSKAFQELAVWSADRYLDHLGKSNNLAGYSVNPVTAIRRTAVTGYYEFDLSDRIKENAQYSILFRGEETENITIVRSIGPRGRSRSVLIADTNGFLSNLSRIVPSEFKLVSDLRFLIRSLRNFYNYHLISFSPPAPIVLPELPDSLTAPFSEEQRQAYETVFRSPFAYIHGAPGTGKTNMVLSRCILRYITARKRVFLLAPTNNALEQMLRGILPTFKDLELDLHMVYRLGMSSHEFAHAFPEVVGDPNTDNILADLRDDEARLRKELQISEETNAALRQEAEKRSAFVNSCRNTGSEILELFQRLSALLVQLEQEEADYHVHSESLDSQERHYAYLSDNLRSLQTQYSADNARLCELERSSRSFLSFFWSKKRKVSVAETISALEEKLHLASSQMEHFCSEHSALTARISSIQDSVKELNNRILRTRSSIHECQFYLRQLSNPIGVFSSAINVALSSQNYATEPIQATISSAQSDYLDWSNAHPLMDDSLLKCRLTDIQAQIKNLAGSARQIQHERALVLAGTVDSSLRELEFLMNSQNNLPVSHVFLDEAGYTSIARGAVAFCLGAPVTYFGDHNQLPPICEVSNISSSEKPLCLWALSAVYLQDLQIQGLDYLYDYCLSKKSNFNAPTFQSGAFVSLSRSYRFGQELARILGEHIYGSQFSGVAPHPFEIIVIDAPYSGGPDDRSSSAEVSAIVNHPDLYASEDAVVLTPYNSQIKLLKERLGKRYDENILTVHRSQGREWDTVILSVVDTQSPYFTNSKLCIGRSVLCTAISRARRRLVLVCDVNAWLRKSDQLITHLIHCGNVTSSDADFPFIF